MNAKKYLFSFAAVLCLFIQSASAQYNPYWQWAKADTLNAKSEANTSSVLAVRGGKALWGRMTAVKRYPPSGISQGNYLISEYDSNGRQLLATAIIGTVQLLDAQADNNGNWYVLGKFYDTAVFPNGTNLYRPNPTINPDADHFMVRYNANTMSIAWIKTIGPLNTVSASSFTLDLNNIYLLADSANNTIVRSMALTNGNTATMLKQGGPSTSTSIQMDAQGNFYIAGSCAGQSINFNGPTENATAPEFYDYIVKYRSNGAHVWHQWLRDDLCIPRKLTLYNNRFLYYTGNVRDSFILGGIKVTGRPITIGGFNFLAARLDTSGTAVWVRQMDPSSGGQALFNDPYHAVVTPDTALVLFAQVSGYVNWQDSVESHLLGAAAGTLVSIGPDNKARWERTALAQYTSSQHVATEGTAVWITGDAYTETGSVMFDTLSLKMPSRKYVSYLAKTKMIRPIPVSPGVGVGGAQVDNIAVYPIPARTTLVVAGLTGTTEVTLSDISGRVVRQQTATGGKTIIDVADLPRGTYVLDMRSSEGAREVRKVVLQ